MLLGTSLVQVALCLSTFGRLVAASDSPYIDALEARQDDDAKEPKSSDSVGKITFDPDSATKTKDAGEEEETGKSASAGKGADLNTAKPSSTEPPSKGGKGSKTSKSSKPTHTQFPADAPAGGVEMLTPSAVGGSTALYKIGDEVTWGWNYTSLLGDPKHVDVLISCAKASATWTLSTNMSFETSVDFKWDTSDQEDDVEQPLLTELYTLIVKDSEAEISDSPEPGYLGAYSGFTFGLYAKQPYTALPDWECVGCNAAAPGFNGQALGLALVMSMITFLSFTWFVTGLGLQ